MFIRFIVWRFKWKKGQKGESRVKRGESSVRTHMPSLDEPIFQGNKQHTKSDFLRLLNFYLKVEKVRNSLWAKLLVNNDTNTWQLSPKIISIIFECKHKKADIRTILHVFLFNTNVAVVSRDNEVLILHVYDLFYRPSKKLHMTYWCNHWLVYIFLLHGVTKAMVLVQ